MGMGDVRDSGMIRASGRDDIERDDEMSEYIAVRWTGKDRIRINTVRLPCDPDVK